MTGGTLKRTFLALLILASLVGTAQSQTNNCYTYNSTTGTMVWNGTCSQTVQSPFQITAGKVVAFYNTLKFQGIDNQIIDFSNLPQGTNKLKSAALADAASFQPAGAGLNLVGIDTSTTITSGTGTKTFSVATGLSFSSNMVVTAYVTASPGTYMQGSVTSYSSTTLVISATYSQGAYTGTGWTIQISGPQGPQGTAGTGGVPAGTRECGYYASLPTNYLWTTGASYIACVSKTTYATLYAAIGDVVTTANGCTTGYFGIPNESESFVLGASGSYPLGSRGGAASHTLTAAELPASIPYTDPGHAHSYPGLVGGIAGSTAGFAPGGIDQGPGNLGTDPNQIGITINPGGGSPHSIMPPYLTANCVIRAQ